MMISETWREEVGLPAPFGAVLVDGEVTAVVFGPCDCVAPCGEECTCDGVVWFERVGSTQETP